MSYQIALPGKRLLDGDALNLLANLREYASTYNITANAGGGRTNAQALNYGLNLIAICATTADSVIMPSAQAGSLVSVTNAGVNGVQIFAETGDVIDGISGSVGINLASGASAWMVSPQRRKWYSVSTSGGGVPTTLQIVTPSTGDTVEMEDSTRSLYVNTSALADLTILLPSGIEDATLVEISFAAKITTLEIQNASAVTVSTAPVTGYGPGAAIQMRYINGSIGWVYWK